MKRLSVQLCAITCAFFVQCSGAYAVTEKVLYAFGKGEDGNSPFYNLIQYKGILYGTTTSGGTSQENSKCTADIDAFGCGTVFSFDPSTGAESVLYNFKGPGDGGVPNNLINYKGTFYGTTEYGGHVKGAQTSGEGTIFSITPGGTFNRLRAFYEDLAKGRVDGVSPQFGLLNVDGTLYGTSIEGGEYNVGTVFRIDPTGMKFKVIHSFNTNVDGTSPYSGLIDVNGTLYGTVADDQGPSYGNVFSMDPKTGKDKVLYTFQCSGDGGIPVATLLNVNGTMYGTTVSCSNGDHGTVFSITPDGTFTTIYRFQYGSDGANPESALINVNGLLYGTTYQGGGSTKCGSFGCGTVYSIDPSTGKYNLVYAFQGGTDGGWPYASLLNVNGTLYGVTVTGGGIAGKCYDYGCGTLFSLKP